MAEMLYRYGCVLQLNKNGQFFRVSFSGNTECIALLRNRGCCCTDTSMQCVYAIYTVKIGHNKDRCYVTCKAFKKDIRKNHLDLWLHAPCSYMYTIAIQGLGLHGSTIVM